MGDTSAASDQTEPSLASEPLDAHLASKMTGYLGSAMVIAASSAGVNLIRQKLCVEGVSAMTIGILGTLLMFGGLTTPKKNNEKDTPQDVMAYSLVAQFIAVLFIAIAFVRILTIVRNCPGFSAESVSRGIKCQEPSAKMQQGIAEFITGVVLLCAMYILAQDVDIASQVTKHINNLRNTFTRAVSAPGVSTDPPEVYSGGGANPNELKLSGGADNPSGLKRSYGTFSDAVPKTPKTGEPHFAPDDPGELEPVRGLKKSYGTFSDAVPKTPKTGEPVAASDIPEGQVAPYGAPQETKTAVVQSRVPEGSEPAGVETSGSPPAVVQPNVTQASGTAVVQFGAPQETKTASKNVSIINKIKDSWLAASGIVLVLITMAVGFGTKSRVGWIVSSTLAGLIFILLSAVYLFNNQQRETNINVGQFFNFFNEKASILLATILTTAGIALIMSGANAFNSGCSQQTAG